MTDNPFSAPTSTPTPIATDPSQQDPSLAGYSDEELKKRLKQTYTLSGSHLYLVVVGIFSLIALSNVPTPTNFVEFLDPLLNFLFGAWFLATAFAAHKRKAIARPMALISFAGVTVIGLLGLIGGGIFGLIRILIGIMGFRHHWQAKAYFGPNPSPSRQQLQNEFERRQSEAAGAQSLA